MAYTSPSTVSSSPWFGPASCPIISPSQWQTQVVTNLCVLALHDHSSSAGEGSGTLSSCLISVGGMREYVSPFFPSASTNWSVEVATTWPGGGRTSTSTNGASIAYDVYLGVGTHDVRVFYGRGSSFGIVTACLHGASVISGNGSFDGYAAGAEQPPTGSVAIGSQLGTFTFRVYTSQEFSASGSTVTGSLVGAGKYSLVLKVSGSGASSTGYIARLGYMEIF